MAKYISLVRNLENRISFRESQRWNRSELNEERNRASDFVYRVMIYQTSCSQNEPLKDQPDDLISIHFLI